MIERNLVGWSEFCRQSYIDSAGPLFFSLAIMRENVENTSSGRDVCFKLDIRRSGFGFACHEATSVMKKGEVDV